ncbi:non-ribosomal peptide synthetase [Paenibacillus oleatilyticus]|uniref:non-ribosomal peptide synthetase n=1 Tax=Paenibacillus oleatilyticus TaxID=2594886 RepID=UPI001C1F9DCC|nr:non-ribosomal peptide synthetase [Paenibacillus oleatilyticus]MBU7314571.1 amino acid adenylation domain-containing protein [Paenibacillus oleatilyticus]
MSDMLSQHILLASGQFDKEKQYWLQLLQPHDAVSGFPREAPTAQSGEKIGRYSREIPLPLIEKIDKISNKSNIARYMILLSGVKYLLAKYTDEATVIVGMPTFAQQREHDGWLNQFVLLKTDYDSSLTFKQWLGRMKETVLAANEHQNFPFAIIAEHLQLPKMAEGLPACTTIVRLDAIHDDAYQAAVGSLAAFSFLTGNSCERLTLQIEYDISQYSARMIEQIAKHFEGYLEKVLHEPDAVLGDIELLSEAEREHILVGFNDTAAAYDTESRTFHEIFEEQAARTPDQTALVVGEAEWTYAALNAQANRLARALRAKGVRRETIVGIMARRSADTIIGALAVMKAGGAYLPIDPAYPAGRIAYLLRDSQAALLLTQRELQGQIAELLTGSRAEESSEGAGFSGEVLYFEDDGLEAESSAPVELLSGPEDLAYVIYTSGTTGQPKGVMIEHRSFVNVAMAYRTVYRLDQFPVRLLQMASFSFDVFSGDMARTFANGGQCVLCPEEVRADIPGLARLLQERGITIFESTPALITPLFDYVQEQGIPLPELKVVIVSSDSCSVEEYAKLQTRFGADIRILNVYGVTEASIDTSYYEEPLDKLPGAGYVPIGKPMPNMRMYVVNDRMQLQPVGVPGELVIGGAGVARGYYRKPELSAEKFVANPFVPGERLYRTGDLVRWMPDGNLEYLGRIDNQVQLRGYRVELGEVESRLLQIASVREAAAIIRDDGQGERYLCAYVVADEDLATAGMREDLAKTLPHFMIPSYFVRLERMPLTPNGKVDRKALPAPDREEGDVSYVAPRNELEDRLAAIWQDVLRLARVGVRDNFFEIGGHSLRATALVSRIHQELKVNVSLREIFQSPTVEALAKAIAMLGGNEYTAIQPAEQGEMYPVSSAQKRIYLLHQLDSAQAAYNMPNVLLLEGKLDRQRVVGACTRLVERHASLRTSFEFSDGELMQRVHGHVDFEVNFAEAKEEEVPAFIRQFIRPFDLASAPLYRVSVICLGEQRHVLLTDIHHIVSDGVSLQILEQEFYELYRGASLPEQRLAYKDYSVWEQGQEGSKEREDQEAYWLEALSGELAVLELPTDEPRPAVRSFEGEQIICRADAGLTEALRRLAQQTGTTLYMVLLAAFSAYLSRITNQEEMIVGTVSSGRSRSELSDIVGMFVNTLAIRSCPEASKTFVSYLSEVKQTLLSAYEHQDYPFDDLVRKLGIQRDPSRTAIFDVMFTMEEVLDPNAMSGELSIRTYPATHPIAQFDLTLTAMELETDIAFRLEYASALFHSSTAERWAKQFIRWLESITQEAAAPIGRIELLSDSDKQQLLVEFNRTHLDTPPNHATIHGRFEEQAGRQPDHPAVICGEASLTFAQLNQRANRLARILRDKGVTKDRIVGIMVRRSVEMIVGLLGILKAGGAYLPIDPSYPDDRIKYLLNDSGAEWLITQTGLQPNADFSLDTIYLDELEKDPVGAEDGVNLEPAAAPNNLAYVIYTSGTTGMPKGVMIEHRSVMNYLTWRMGEYGFNASHRMVQLFSFAFDGFLSSFFAPLLAGSTSILLPDEGAKDPLVIRKAIVDHAVTHFMCVPSLYAALIECLSAEDSRSLKVITLGGEALPQRLVDEHNAKNGHIELTNEYGPTENSIGGTITRHVQQESPITIGRPIANNRVYILNADYRLSPIGVVGELCIGGASLARGYRNQPELTAAKFVANPLVTGTLMYKTGDLAKWLPDGRIEYVGRADEQVKIRGYRIELSEIQSTLLRIEGVKEAVVTVYTDDSAVRHLCGYFTADTSVTMDDVKSSLASLLPNYMIPSFLVKLDRIPLTPNGKADRKMLPVPNHPLEGDSRVVAPRTPLEEELVRLWEELLEVKPIGIRDNFFELGGHSLKAMMLVARIYKQLQVEVALTSVFQAPTIEALAQLLQSKRQSGFAPIAPAPPSERYPVSSAQRRLYILRQLEGAEESYNMPAAFLVESALDVQRLNDACARLMHRHESLRTSFEMVDGETFQRIHPAVDFQIEHGAATEEEVPSLLASFIRPFDLDRAPLWRVALYQAAEDRCVLLMDMHHIISDGVSVNLMMDELFRLYNGEEIPPLPLQYKDYACWQQEMLQSEAMKKQEAYWLDSLSGSLPVLSLPADYPRPAIQSFTGGEVEFATDRELTAALYRIGQQTGTTLFMVLFAAYNAFVSRMAGQDDIITGTVISGRPTVDVEGIVGMFVNTLAVRTFPEGEKTFAAYLQEVKMTLLLSYENQDYPFEELVKQRVAQRDMSRNPLFDTMFTLSHKHEGGDHGVRMRSLPFEHAVTQFELTLSVIEEEDILSFSFEYAAALFKRETIERWKDLFSQWLTSLVMDTDLPISAVELLPPQEKHRLLVEFNDSAAAYPAEKTAHQLFEEQAERTPDAIALKQGAARISYRALNDRANRLARTLRRKGVRPETVVAVMEERSVDMIVAVLAVLKAGGAYVPIDPDYPQDRIDYMLADSQASILLTKSRFLQDRQWDGIVLDLAEEASYAEDGSNLASVTDMHHLAYFIYTSGSTGRPKGVMNEHRNLAAYLYTFIQRFQLDHRDTVLHLQSVSFDGAVDEMYLALLCGGTVYIANKEEGLDADLLEAVIEQENVTVLFCSSLLLSELNQRLSPGHPVRLFYPGGDVVKPSYYSNLTDRLVYNMYGPTEATVTTTSFNCLESSGHNVPIGKPMPNKQVYILGPQGQMQPIGVPGELYVAGVGLARGYLNQPELTTAKFVANPFIPGERMYRTGDLARWLPDGNVEYLGRMDQQVKIRGYRVELGEIEAQLQLHAGVGEAVVLADQSPDGEKILVAYIVAEERQSGAYWRHYLAQSLPYFMIPSAIIQLDEMPLTPNGKIDRNALLAIRMREEAAYSAPLDAIEVKLVSIWEEILGRDGIGRIDHFFELGGHSLKAMAVVKAISRQFQVDMPLSQIFKLPVLQDQAMFIRNHEASVYTQIDRIDDKMDVYPLSSAQKRMYMLQQMQPASIVYNMPDALLIEGNLDINRLEQALWKLIRRHESLRTSFVRVETEAFQRIEDEVVFALTYREPEHALHHDADIEAAMAGMMQTFVKPFELDKAPLFRAELVQINPNQQILLLDMHHIIGDGLSNDILMEELGILYANADLPELRLHYKDYAVWQNRLAAQGELAKQEAYWLGQFVGSLPVLQLPTDRPRPKVSDHRGDVIQFRIDVDVTSGLRRLAAETGATLNMVLLAGYTLLLHAYTGQEDIVVGTPVAGRLHADLDKIIGMFVNTLAIRSQPTNRHTILSFIHEMKTITLEAYENQSYPFEELVKKTVTVREANRNPLFDTMFTLQSAETDVLPSLPLPVRPLDVNVKTVKVDLTVTAKESHADGIVFDIEYATALFERSTVQRMGRHLAQLLSVMANRPEETISAITLIEEEEKRQICEVFNNTQTAYPRHQSLACLFEEQVEKTPDRVAVVFGEEQLTYRELDAKSNQVAGGLLEQGIKPGGILAILMDRSLDMVTAILAVLKTGNAYLPIDPEYPQGRIQYMLQDSGARVLLTREAVFAQAASAAGSLAEIVRMDAIMLGDQEARPAIAHGKGSDLAYVMYTSGTTGKPKGIMTTHANVARVVKGTDYIEIGEDDVVASLSNYAFDGFTFDFFGALLNGAALVVVPKSDILDIHRLSRILIDRRVTIMFVTTALFNLLVDTRLDSLTRLRKILFGGERVSVNHVRSALAALGPDVIVHMYGPTESTVYATFYPVDDIAADAATIPIGKPLSNTEAYILGAGGQLMPIGIPGELCLAGDGLALGYLNLPEMTAEKFVPHPLEQGRMIYRTGDLARFLPDGNIEFMDRIDQQVKIRGHRIELGEIESRMLELQALREATVLIVEKAGGKSLCAYYVTDSPISAGELREELAKRLPEYMIPAYFVPLTTMPLTPNGKIDRRALPEPTSAHVALREQEQPQNAMEETLLAIWKKILDKDEIGIHDNFFEIGGHSLLATRLAFDIFDALQVNFPLVEIFNRPTVCKLAEFVSTLLPAAEEKGQDEQLLLLKEGAAKDKQLFFIHAGDGEAEPYVPFSGYLSDSFQCWAIKVAPLQHHEPVALSMEEIAGSYVDKIRSIQPDGCYYLAGWSIGGTIAFEMARLLEALGFTVGFLGLIDSPFVQGDAGDIAEDSPFEPAAEMELLTNMFAPYLHSPLVVGLLEQTAGSEQVWHTFLTLAEQEQAGEELLAMLLSNKELIASMPEVENCKSLPELIKIYNVCRSLTYARDHYAAANPIAARIDFFQALTSPVENMGMRWRALSSQPVNIHEVAGDHYSMFRKPLLQGLASAFDRVLTDTVFALNRK